MSDLHFLNARLRAMRGRLLPPGALDRLARLPDLPAFAAALRDTPYGPAIEAAGAGGEGDVDRLEEAFRRDFSGALSRLLDAAGEGCADMVRRCLGFWEAKALRAVVRGKAARRPPAEILATLVPTGLHDEAALAALCGQPDLRSVVDLLATWREPCAVPLRKALAASRDASDPRPLEAALDRCFLGGAPGRRPAERDDADLFLSLAADRANLSTALAAVAARDAPDAFRPAFLPGGSVYRRADFEAMLSAASVPEALALASRPVFAPVIRRILALGAGTPPAVVDRQLDRVLLRALRARMRVDPLGAAPTAAYLLEKEREVTDLRTIFRGLLAGLDEALLSRLVLLEA